MKNKVLKRTLAAALALTLVSGAPAAVKDGKGIFPPAITANAATKHLEEGTIIGLGDTIDFGDKTDKTYINVYDEWDEIPDSDYYVQPHFGKREISEIYYRKDFVNGNTDVCVFDYGASSIKFYVTERVDYPALKVVSGSGTKEDPITFAVVDYPWVELPNVNVALDDSVTLKYYAAKKSVDDTKVESVTLDGPNKDLTIAKDDFKTVTIDETDYYIFSYPLYATQLDENVTIQFLDAKEREIPIAGKNNSYTYNVNRYCDTLIADTTLKSKVKNAAAVLRNIGSASKNYFDEGNEISFIDLTEDVKSDLTDFSSNFTSDEAKLSLVLDSKLAVRLYIEGLVEGETSDNSEYTAVAGLDGKACFELKDLSPTDLGKQYDITYKNKTYSFSALSYCARAVNNTTNPKASALAQAVYEYNKYLKKYANPIVIKTITINNTYSFATDPEITYEEGMTWGDYLIDPPDSTFIIEDGYVCGTANWDRWSTVYTDTDQPVKPTDIIDENIQYYFHSMSTN